MQYNMEMVMTYKNKMIKTNLSPKTTSTPISALSPSSSQTSRPTNLRRNQRNHYSMMSLYNAPRGSGGGSGGG
jgi:hypothetical protein